MEPIPEYEGPGKKGAFGRAINKYNKAIQARTPLQGENIKLSEHSDGVEIGLDIPGVGGALSTQEVTVCIGGSPATITVVVAS